MTTSQTSPKHRSSTGSHSAGDLIGLRIQEPLVANAANLQAIDLAEQALTDLETFVTKVKDAVFASSSSAAACFANPNLQARRELRKRQKRNDTFGDSLFSDPAWDMLLLLFSELPTRDRLFVKELSGRGGIPLTTALRWISTLEVKGLVFRQDDDNDRRAVNIGLTSLGRDLMMSYFAD